MREFHQTARTGKTRVWRIGVEGDQVTTEFGELGGALQRVTDTAQPKNVGRSNEVSAEQAAVAQAEREVLLKTRSGYVEVGGAPAAPRVIDLVDLPQSLSFYKPDNSLSAQLERKLEAGEALLSRKRDGEMMVILVTEAEGIRVYSRKMLRSHHLEQVPWEVRFAHLVDELNERFADLPGGTILLGDMVRDRATDDRWYVGSVMKSKTEEALRIQAENGYLHFYCWDIAFLAGDDLVSTVPVGERYALIESWFTKHGEFIVPVEYYEVGWVERMSPEPGTAREKAMRVAKENGWEGWVVVDPDGIYGDRGYNFRGKPDRPGKYCGKVKPVMDDDFLALWDPACGVGEFGTGKYQGLIGAVELHQYDSAGNLVRIGKCGNGFDEEFLRRWSSPEHFPMVLRVLYTDRTYVSQGDKTNALTYPRFAERREDKSVDECVNLEL